MKIVCFVSGSGTNYAHIVEKDPNHDYFVFTNRPECGGTKIAKKNKHPVIELSHVPFLHAAREKYGPGNVPRNCLERVVYEQEASRLIEERIGQQPDLICLAGYDQWTTDWMVDRYYPGILNIHPGDTTKGYAGLHWVPSAMAILAGDEAIRSTLFLVDRGEDNGPVLIQSRPLSIERTLESLEAKGTKGLSDALRIVKVFSQARGVKTYGDFQKVAGKPEKEMIRLVCENLQEALKVSGDWEIYPFGVHDLIGRGRVEVESRTVYVDGRQLPEHGYRLDEHGEK